MGLLDNCYKEDPVFTNLLLTHDLAYWSHWTCLSLAVSANLKDFMSHPACQRLISEIWMGGMKDRKNSSYQVIMGLLFPPIISTIEFKTAKEFQLMPQTEAMYEENIKILDKDTLGSGRNLKDKNTVGYLSNIIIRNKEFNNLNSKVDAVFKAPNSQVKAVNKDITSLANSSSNKYKFNGIIINVENLIKQYKKRVSNKVLR